MSIWDDVFGNVFLVGNGPVRRDWSRDVDRADTVFRFNFCNFYGINNGSKTDVLIVNNVGQPAMSMLANGLPECGSPAKICFGRNTEVHRNYRDRCLVGNFPKALISVEEEMIEKFNIEDHESISYERYSTLFDQLIEMDGRGDFAMPSLGFVVLRNIMTLEKVDKVRLIGFSFEGWPFHPWSKEQKIAEAYERQGALEILT